jgi:hypothetical protein
LGGGAQTPPIPGLDQVKYLTMLRRSDSRLAFQYTRFVALQTLPSGGMNEHLECRQFDVFEPVPDSDAKMLGSFIVGIPAMTFREFQNQCPGFELEPAILRSISSEERRKIGLHLWVKFKPETIFIARTSRPYPGDIPEEPTFQGETEKRFWVFSKSGKEVLLKYS